MSDSGKSVLAAGLCRIFKQDGYSVAPFKSQNMALNSYITGDGLEMGRAQVMQAEAAGIEPDARMNPVLLKPSSDTGSQVIVLGEVRDQMSAMEYHEYKPKLIPEIKEAFYGLACENDIIVIEGAGSPAEINLAENDVVNMGLARMVDAPVILVGDIDRGGVFAQLYGTVELMEPEDRARIRGLVINKFRGDPEILEPGLEMLEEKTGIPVLGVIPMLDVDLDDEDSLAPRLMKKEHDSPLDIAVIRLPRLSNFTDFNALDQKSLSGVRYVETTAELGSPDLIVIPGTKSTTADLLWLRQSGLESEILKHASRGGPVLGVCGGYQMLGRTLSDPDGNEGDVPFLNGLRLSPTDTVFTADKSRTRVRGKVVWEETAGEGEDAPGDGDAERTGGRGSDAGAGCHGSDAGLDGLVIEGYEIHMGRTTVEGEPFCRLDDGKVDGCRTGNVIGTYIHGLFDTGEFAEGLIRWLCRRKGIDPGDFHVIPHETYVQQQYDILAENVRKSLNMDAIYDIMGIE